MSAGRAAEKGGPAPAGARQGGAARLWALVGRWPVATSALLALVVLVTDYVTGKAIHFPFLYLVPIAFAAWWQRSLVAVILAVAMPATRVGFHYPWHELEALSASMLNGAVNAVTLLVAVFLVHRLGWQTRALARRVQLLEGIVPICASCKSVRNDDGAYEPVETYVAKRSKAVFSHGLCPACAKRLYPDFCEEDPPR